MKHQFRNHTIYSDDNLIHYMRSNIDIGSSLLDLGCGPKIYSQALLNLCAKQITVDAWPDVEPDILADLETVDIKTLVDSVDYILMIDFIEHLDKAAGRRLLEDCKKIVKKKIFLLTPLEEIWNDNHKNVNNPELWCYGNQFDMHKSLWYLEDFVGFQPMEFRSLKNYFLGHWARHG
jgi:hypothetical protein